MAQGRKQGRRQAGLVQQGQRRGGRAVIRVGEGERPKRKEFEGENGAQGGGLEACRIRMCIDIGSTVVVQSSSQRSVIKSRKGYWPRCSCSFGARAATGVHLASNIPGLAFEGWNFDSSASTRLALSLLAVLRFALHHSMILLPTLLGLGALSQAKPVHQRTEGQLLLQRSDSPLPPPACASYHGRLPIRPHTTLYYVSPECATDSGARGVPFEWSEEGRLVWVGDSSLDETVDALMIRRDELHAMRMLSQLQQTSQSAFGAEETAWKTVLALGEGQGELMLVGDDAFLTMGEDWSFKEMVAISQDPLPAPLFVANSFGALNESSGIPARDVKRVQDLLSNLKFSPLISTLLGTFNRHQEITKDVRYLSNEDQSSATSDEERWVSRHSMSEGSVKASAWLLRESLSPRC